MTVHIITIGDELLIGQIVDTNSAQMARLLLEIGATVTGKTTVGDHLDDMVVAFRHATSKADVTLVTGGLGPTKDDVTKKALAKFYNTGFVFDQGTFEHIHRIFQKLGKPVTDTLRNQCLMPQNAIILKNKLGTAPGLWFDEGGKVLVAMPGVPFEMEYLMEYEVIPRLRQRFQPLPTAHRTLLTAGEGESTLAEYLKKFEEELPEFARLAYLPSIRRVRLRLTVAHPDAAVVKQTLSEQFQRMEKLIPAHLIVGYDDDTLESVIGKMLKSQGKFMVSAESCTGGYLAHLITSVPGSSSYYKGSVIAYSNELKMKILGVSQTTLETYGAVSEPTVQEMVAGVLRATNADFAIATSGIAGPDGGTPQKPVGTIWVAVGDHHRTETQLLRLGKDRIRNIQYTAWHALDMLRRFLKNSTNS